MGLMDKFKNLFTEEVEEEIIEEPIKKEVMQVEIPSPEVKKEIKKENIETEKKEEPKKEEFKFPFFDDDDFGVLEKNEKPEKKERKKSSYRKEPKEIKEVYSPPKEEKKIFKPTPIISPVYGILDKDYQKEEIRSKNSKLRSYYNPKEATVDEIRNKAYGTLEDDIETTLFGKSSTLFDEENQPKKSENKVSDINNDDNFNDLLGERPRHGTDEESDLTDLLKAELGKDDAEEKPRKISDDELFNMIDSMYQKEKNND